jgi:hypothetical protein
LLYQLFEQDQMFADRFHVDLQKPAFDVGFAPEDLPIGATSSDNIDEAFKLTDKLLGRQKKRSAAGRSG